MQTQLENRITELLAEITGLHLTFIGTFKGTVFTSYLYSGAGGYCDDEKRRKNLENELWKRLNLNYIYNRVRVIANDTVSSNEILVALPNIQGEGMSFLELMRKVEKTIPPLRTMSDKELLSFWKECAVKGQGMCADLKGILPIACGIDYKGTPIVKSISEELSGFQFVIGARSTGLTSYLNAAILSLAYLRSPRIVKFVVIDPSGMMPSPQRYGYIPHMALPLAQGINECTSALRWCCQEIDRRIGEFRNDRYFSQLRPEGLAKTIESGASPSPFIVVFVNDMNFLTRDKNKDIAKMLTTISGAWKQGFRVLVCANEITQGNLSGEAYDFFQSRIWAGLKIDSLKRYNHFSAESLTYYKNAYGSGEVSEEYQTVFIQNSAREQDYYENLIASFYSSKDAEVIKLFKDKRWKDAIEAFEKGWRTNPELQYRVAECFNEGKGVVEDKAKAFEWYLKAAEGGHPKAQRDVGMAYLYGTSVDKNIEKGLTWLEKAATQNDGLASLFLGREYFQGKILPQDYSKATEWLEKALAKRDPLFSVEIALCLGVMYMDEQSEIYNLQKAREAFETAEDVAVNGECSDLFKSGGQDRNIKQLKELRDKLFHVKMAQGLEKLKALAASTTYGEGEEGCICNGENATEDCQSTEKKSESGDDAQYDDGTSDEEDSEPIKDENGEEVIISNGTCFKKSNPSQKAIFKDDEGRYQLVNGDPVPYNG